MRKEVVEISAELWSEENKIKMANNLMAVFQWEKVIQKYYSLKFEDLHCHENVASKTKVEGKYVLDAIKPYFK